MLERHESKIGLLLSGPVILLIITLKLSLNWKNSFEGFVGWFLVYISSSNIFRKLLWLEIYHQNSEVFLGITGMDGLTHSCIKQPKEPGNVNTIPQSNAFFKKYLCLLKNIF